MTAVGGVSPLYFLIVYVGKIDAMEVDFVAQNSSAVVYGGVRGLVSVEERGTLCAFYCAA